MSLSVQVSVVSLSWSPVTTPTPTHIFVTQKFFTSAHLTTYQRCVQYTKAQGSMYHIAQVLEAEEAKFGGRRLHRGSAWAVQLSCASAHPRSDRSYRIFASPVIHFLAKWGQCGKGDCAEVDQPVVSLPKLCNIRPLQHTNIVLLANAANKDVCKPCCWI